MAKAKAAPTRTLRECFIGDRVRKGAVEGTVRRFIVASPIEPVALCELVFDTGELEKYPQSDEGWAVVERDDDALPPGEERATPEQPEMPLSRLWPDFEGHVVREVQLRLGGRAELHAGFAFADDLAPRLKGNARLQLVATVRVDHVGHDVVHDKQTGVAIGRVGVAKLRLISLTDEDGLAKALHDAFEFQADAIVEVERFLESFGGRPSVDAEPNPVREALWRIRRMLTLGRAVTDAIEADEAKERARAAQQAALP